MNQRFALPLIPFLVAACASGGGAPLRSLPPLPLTPAAAPDTALHGWQSLDLNWDGVPGTSSERALAELLPGRPAGTVVVAVIDGGVDTAHVDLRDAMQRLSHAGLRFDLQRLYNPRSKKGLLRSLNAGKAIAFGPGSAIARGAAIVAIPAIFSPFPEIAVHIV